MNLLSPWYLLALLAVALPWLLHRFSNAQPDRRDFPSTRFLEATVPPVSRRRKLRHRLLLALRVLAVAALALLFAQPWLSRPEALSSARQRHIVAIDTSLSMRAGERFERALEEARDAVAAIPVEDAVQLLVFDTDVVTLGDAEDTKDTVLATLSSASGVLAPGFAAADYGRLMQRLDRMADETELPTRATLITDAQRSSLPERRNALYAPRLSAMDIVDVSDDESNVSLSAEASSSNGAQARVVVTLQASASLAGDPALTRDVVLSNGDRTLATRRVQLEPNGRERVVFDDVTLPEVREPRFRVALSDDDSLPDDDSMDVPVKLDGERRVALGALDVRADDAARVFVTTALEADGAASVDATMLATGQLPEESRRLVVFASMEDGGSLPVELERHVARGGAALVVETSRREEAGESALARSTRIDGEGAGLDISSAQGQAVGRVDESHPLGLGEVDWSGVRFYSLGPLEPTERDRVLLETRDRQPVLIERASDSGLLLMMNERLDGVDSTLPFQPAFVEIMRRVVEWFDADRAVPDRITVGSPLLLPFNVQVITPEGDALGSLSDTTDPAPVVLASPGLYTVAGALGDQNLRVEIDPRESDLTRLAPEALSGWRSRHDQDAKGTGNGLSDDVSDDVSAVDGDEGVGATGAATQTALDEGASADAEQESDALSPTLRQQHSAADRLPLWPLLLPLLAIVLLVETLFANRRLDVRRDGT